MLYCSFRLLLFLCYLTGTALSQSDAKIAGTVVDRNGNSIIGANVFLVDSYDGATSFEGGRFSFSTALQGEQILRVTFLGYEDTELPVNLNGDSLNLHITLAVGALELDQVVITAGSFAAGGEKRREVLQPLDIVTTAGATADLAGVFNTLPGTQAVGEEGRLFVRGGEGREAKTFIDGMLVQNFYSPAAPNTPSRSRFLPFMFSGASFSTGGYSAEYGQALSSALVLHSKPVANQNRLDISLMSVGVDAAFTKAWDASSLSGKLQYTNIDPYFSLINQDIDWIDPPTSYEGSFAYRKKMGTSGILKLFGNGNHSSFSLNRYSLDEPGQPIWTDLRNNYAYFNATLHDELAGGWIYRAGTSLTYNHDRIGLNQDEVDQPELGFHGKFTLQKRISAELELKTGTEYFLTDFQQTLRDAGEGEVFSAGFTDHLPAFFAEADLHLSAKLLARVGLRSEYYSLSRDWHVAPRASLAYKTGGNSQISAAIGRYQQAPATEQRLHAPTLRPEKATHYILNYQIMREGRTFRIETYHKDYDDLIKYQSPREGSPSMHTNAGSGFARGIDLFWRDNRTIKNVDYWFSYSFLDTRRDYRDFPEAAVPSFASRHNFSIVYKQFVPTIKSQIGATFRYASGRPYHDPNEPGFQNRQTKAYQDLSFNLSYLISQNMILHASATNVLGRNNIFGREFASRPDEEGIYASRAIRQPARRFLFLGLFITLSKDQVLNQLPNL